MMQRRISEDTLITAYFAEAQNFKISVAPVTVGSDGKTTVTTGVDVTVKAQRVDGTVIIESGEDGIYEVSRGDNVTIQVTSSVRTSSRRMVSSRWTGTWNCISGSQDDDSV